jgi:hypothetical protein
MPAVYLGVIRTELAECLPTEQVLSKAYHICNYYPLTHLQGVVELERDVRRRCARRMLLSPASAAVRPWGGSRARAASPERCAATRPAAAAASSLCTGSSVMMLEDSEKVTTCTDTPAGLSVAVLCKANHQLLPALRHHHLRVVGLWAQRRQQAMGVHPGRAFQLADSHAGKRRESWQLRTGFGAVAAVVRQPRGRPHGEGGAVGLRPAVRIAVPCAKARSCWSWSPF